MAPFGIGDDPPDRSARPTANLVRGGRLGSRQICVALSEAQGNRFESVDTTGCRRITVYSAALTANFFVDMPLERITLDLSGACRLGPDVEYVAARDWFGPAEHKLAAFHRAACALLGPIGADRLAYAGCGIRPKLRGPDDSDERDFAVFESPGCVHLVGIESPGLTAALALAERVVALVG